MSRVLVGDGGGQHRTWMWGFRTEIHNLGLPLGYWDFEIGPSGDGFNSAYALDEQWYDGMLMWLEYLPNGFWKTFRNDMDYLERGLRVVHPINVQAFAEKKTKVLIPLTSKQTLEPELFCLNNSLDPIQLLLASAAMPGLTGAFEYGGRKYYDPGLTCQPPLKFAGEFRPKEIWVFLNSPEGYRINNRMWKLLSLCPFFDRQERKLLNQMPERRNRILQEIESRSDLKVIRPKSPIPISWRSTDKAAIRRVYDQGRMAAQMFALDQGW